MISLFELTVPNYIRVLNATVDVMEAGLKYFEENNIDTQDIIDMRLAEDMLPFSFQVNITHHQAVNGVKGLIKGEFSPPGPLEPLSYQALIDYLRDGVAELESITEDEVNNVSNKPMYFNYSDKSIPFSTENFVLAFTYPNLYFHATTIYDMLRMKGVPLNKPLFMGRLPIGLPE